MSYFGPYLDPVDGIAGTVRLCLQYVFALH